MKHKPRRVLLRKLLVFAAGKKRMAVGIASILMGTFLMLFATITWTAFRSILADERPGDKSNATYITIAKEISTEGNLAEQKPQAFSRKEEIALRSLPGVTDIGRYIPGRFPVEVSLVGDTVKFSTRLFLEAVPERFLDEKPPDWRWQYRSRDVPVILSNEFLNLYNFGYAPNEGVPQLKGSTIKTLNFTLRIGAGADYEDFSAHVVGFSNRINSILVPESFIEYGNARHGSGQQIMASRLVLEVTDPSDSVFVAYVQNNNYSMNRELLRWSRLRELYDIALAGMVGLSVMVIFSVVLSFLLFARMTLSAARANAANLAVIGYSPAFLHRFMFVRYCLIIAAVLVLAAIMAVVAQVRVSKYLLQWRIEVPTFPALEVWICLAVLAVVYFISLKWLLK